MSSITYQQFTQCYEVKCELGSGTCAQVFLIEKRANRSKRYAYKKIFLKTVEEVAVNMNEIEIIKLLKDKAVPKIYHYFTLSNSPKGNHPAFEGRKNSHLNKNILLGIIMERCQTDVETFIQRIRNDHQNHFDNDQLWNFLKVMVDVLAKMQRQGILHRDIKPPNILMNTSKGKKQFKLSDFGYSVYKNQFSQQTITGTMDYTSPRVKKKFDRPEVNIDGINQKDDVFSLGKTLLQMMRLGNCRNEDIKTNLQKIQLNFDPNLVYILKKMLTIDENQRPDFIQIEKEIVQMEIKKHPMQFVDLTKSYTEESQEETVRNSQSQQQSHLISRQKSVTNSKGSQIQSQMTADSSQKKPLNFSKFAGSYNERETQYISNELSQVKIQESTKYLMTQSFNLANEIYCIQAIGEYLLLGMNTRLGVIPLKNNTAKHIYLLQLVNLVPPGSDFKIKKIHAFPTIFLLMLEQKSQFVYFQNKTFCEKLNDVIENHEKYRKNNTLRPAFPESNSPLYGGYKVYNLGFESFLAHSTQKDITCIHMLNTAFKGRSNNALFGFSDGSLAFFNQKALYKNDQVIERMEILGENQLIITTKKDIKILQFPQSKPPNEQQKCQVSHSCKLESEIVHLKVIQPKKNSQDKDTNQQQNDDDNLIPFLEIVTADCKKIILGRNLEEITVTKLQTGQKTIMYVLQNNFNCSISKTKQNLPGGSSLVKIKQHQKNDNDDFQLYYLTSGGKIKHVNSKKTLWQSPLEHFNKFHIAQNKVILTNFNGQIQILSFSDEPPKRCKVSQSQQEKQIESIEGRQYQSIRKFSKNVEQSEIIFRKPTKNILENSYRNDYKSKIPKVEMTKVNQQNKKN